MCRCAGPGGEMVTRRPTGTDRDTEGKDLHRERAAHVDRARSYGVGKGYVRVQSDQRLRASGHVRDGGRDTVVRYRRRETGDVRLEAQEEIDRRNGRRGRQYILPSQRNPETPR